MLVLVNQTTQHHFPGDHNCNTHHQNLKSQKFDMLYKRYFVAVLKCKIGGGHGPKVGLSAVQEKEEVFKYKSS
jgi:hypothetical protein